MELRTGGVTLGVTPGTMLAKVDVAETVDRAGLTLLDITPPGADDPAALPAGETALDPVCRMRIPVTEDARQFAQPADGATHYFCSDYCLTRFRQDPARFKE